MSFWNILSSFVTDATIGGSTKMGALLFNLKEEKRNSLRREGERIATAKYLAKVEKLKNTLKDVMRRLEDDKSYFQLIIALFAIGIATANADGEITNDELEDLNEFVGGIASPYFPHHVRETITKLVENPPNFNTAMKEVKKLGDKVDMKMFEYVIELVATADGNFDSNERALMEAFRRQVA